jgi:predicted dehydrogenase
MADYCCYGAILAYWFAGCNAVAVSGMRLNSITTMGDAEDNAVMMVRFPNCYALLEGTWTTYNHTFKSPIVYCTKGSIAGDYKSDKVIFYNTDGQAEEIPNEPLPKKLLDVAEAFVHHMDTGEPLHYTTQPEFNLDALAILDAGIRSSDSGKVELVDNIHWRIG